MKHNEEKDVELGTALRATLSAPNNAAFVTRVMARIDDAPVAPLFWDLLASWARKGIPAAIMIAALTAFLLALPREPAANLEDVLMGGSAADASLTNGNDANTPVETP